MRSKLLPGQMFRTGVRFSKNVLWNFTQFAQVNHFYVSRWWNEKSLFRKTHFRHPDAIKKNVLETSYLRYWLFHFYYPPLWSPLSLKFRFFQFQKPQNFHTHDFSFFSRNHHDQWRFHFTHAWTIHDFIRFPHFSPKHRIFI